MDTNWKYCTLPTAKRLRELGLPQGISDFYWKSDRTPDPYIVYKHSRYMFTEGEILCDAPDLSEAMRVLPWRIGDLALTMIKVGEIFTVGYAVYNNDGSWSWGFKEHQDKNPAEAACRMIVWLAEQGLMDLKGVRL